MIKTLRLKLTLNFKTVIKRRIIKEKITSTDVTKVNVKMLNSVKIKTTYNFYIEMIVQFNKNDKKKYNI